MVNRVSSQDYKRKRNLDPNEGISSPAAHTNIDDTRAVDRYYDEADISEQVTTLWRHTTLDEEISAGERRPSITYFAWVRRTTEELEDEFASRQLEWEEQ
ncbi:MAG: hypothetical protein Q9209_007527 [Squamulea sp. 1 TL-2023]